MVINKYVCNICSNLYFLSFSGATYFKGSNAAKTLHELNGAIIYITHSWLIKWLWLILMTKCCKSPCIYNSHTPRLCCNVKHSSDLTPYRTLWFAAEVVIFQLCVSLLWNLNLRIFCARKCICYPFSCDMGLDGTLTSHIELVCDSFDMACQSAI